jgi:hypothetical protein
MGMKLLLEAKRKWGKVAITGPFEICAKLAEMRGKFIPGEINSLIIQNQNAIFSSRPVYIIVAC